VGHNRPAVNDGVERINELTNGVGALNCLLASKAIWRLRTNGAVGDMRSDRMRLPALSVGPCRSWGVRVSATNVSLADPPVNRQALE